MPMFTTHFILRLHIFMSIECCSKWWRNEQYVLCDVSYVYSGKPQP